MIYELNFSQVNKSILYLMAISSKTAPKAAGRDFLIIKMISKNEVEKLALDMIEHGERNNIKSYIKDGKSVLKSEAALLIGLKNADSLGNNCGACGFNKCSERITKKGRDFDGPQCVFRLIDLGVAIGSAVKTASLLNVDNRIMYTAGLIANQTFSLKADVLFGIPISITGKSIYFDR